MLENEKKVTELKEEELKDVAGGGGVVYLDDSFNGTCPVCGCHTFLDAGCDPWTGRVGSTCGECGAVLVNGPDPFAELRKRCKGE